MIEFNPSNIYVLFYVSPVYGDSYIFPDLVNWLGAFLSLLVFV